MNQWDGYVHLFLAAMLGLVVNFLLTGAARGEYAMGVFIVYPLVLLAYRGVVKKRNLGNKQESQIPPPG